MSKRGRPVSITPGSADLNRLEAEQPAPKRHMTGSVAGIDNSNSSVSPNQSGVAIARFRCSGALHEVSLARLQRFPQSRLCALAQRHLATCPASEVHSRAIWVDRGAAFQVAMDFVRSDTGRVALPPDVSKSQALIELRHWGLPVHADTLIDDDAEEDAFWKRVAKTIKRNVGNEVLRNVLLLKCFKRDPSVKFFFEVESSIKGVKPCCLDAAHLECPYCGKKVYYHQSDSVCLRRRHPGRWDARAQHWTCCRVEDINLVGCTELTHYEALFAHPNGSMLPQHPSEAGDVPENLNQ
ncbi:MAG: hypothetical protein MHM6MM_000674 [Cercozoa sp. M6MM]